MLRANNLTKRFGETTALRGVSLSINRGEIVGLVGESGCGKSTLSRVLTRLISPDSGSVTLDELPGCISAREFYKNVQIVFQDAFGALNRKHNVVRAISEPIKNLTKLRGEAIKKRSADLMREVGLPIGAAAKYPHELSSGMRQRVAIIRALAAEPSYLICDEPVSNLDVPVSEQILQILSELCRAKNAGCLFISHDLAVTAKICDRVCVMFAGKIIEEIPSLQLADIAAHPYTRSLFTYVFELERCCCTNTVQTTYDIAEIVCAYRLQCPHATDICAKAEPELIGKIHKIACHHPAWKGHRHA